MFLQYKFCPLESWEQNQNEVMVLLYQEFAYAHDNIKES